MTTVILDAQGNALHTSRNLRGILDHCRSNVVASVSVQERADGSAVLQVRWHGGSTVETVFASCLVCIHWCRRRRNWPQADIRLLPRSPAK